VDGVVGHEGPEDIADIDDADESHGVEVSPEEDDPECEWVALLKDRFSLRLAGCLDSNWNPFLGIRTGLEAAVGGQEPTASDGGSFSCMEGPVSSRR